MPITFNEFCKREQITLSDGIRLFTKSKYVDESSQIPFIGLGLHTQPYNLWIKNDELPDDVVLSDLTATECSRRLAMQSYDLRQQLLRRYEDLQIRRSKRVNLLPYLGQQITVYGELTGKKPLKFRDNWISFCLSPIYKEDTAELLTDHQWFDVAQSSIDQLGDIEYGDKISVTGLVRSYDRYEYEPVYMGSYTDYGIRADRISLFGDDTCIPITRTFNHKNAPYRAQL